MNREVTAPRPSRLYTVLLVALFLVVFVTAVAQAVPIGYQFIQFDVPGGGQTELIGINNRGQVVGSYGPGLPNSGQGFLYAGGVITPIHVPDSIETHPYGINDSGDIVGQYLTSAGYSAFLLRDSVYTTPVPGGQGRAINNAGQIVGLGVGTGGSFIWSEGEVSTLTYPDGTAAFAYDINDHGDIAGHLSGPAGFRFSQGAFELLPLRYVFNTNNAGDIVGATDGGSGAYLYSSGVLTTLTGPNGNALGAAHGINDLGQIVGFYEDASGRHGFILTPDGVAFPPGRPVPEPPSLLLVLAGVVVAAARWRKAWPARHRSGTL